MDRIELGCKQTKRLYFLQRRTSIVLFIFRSEYRARKKPIGHMFVMRAH